jgi:hypothetical protein
MNNRQTGLELAPGLYVMPTAAGAYYALSRRAATPMRRLILALARERTSPAANADNLARWLGSSDTSTALALLQQAQSLGLVQGYDTARDLPGLGVGHELGQLLPWLSSVGKGLIVDWNGLLLATAGLDADAAAALAALSADLIAVQERHSERLVEHLGLGTHGWAAVNPTGSSRIGAWPLYVGDERLMLVLLGEPRFEQPAFLGLAWVLINRYG